VSSSSNSSRSDDLNASDKVLEEHLFEQYVALPVTILRQTVEAVGFIIVLIYLDRLTEDGVVESDSKKGSVCTRMCGRTSREGSGSIGSRGSTGTRAGEKRGAWLCWKRAERRRTTSPLSRHLPMDELEVPASPRATQAAYSPSTPPPPLSALLPLSRNSDIV